MNWEQRQAEPSAGKVLQTLSAFDDFADSLKNLVTKAWRPCWINYITKIKEGPGNDDVILYEEFFTSSCTENL